MATLAVRKAPQRTCVGCRGTTGKRELVRVVRTPEGRVEVDPRGRSNGRGAYVHNDPACWRTALSRGSLDRALKTQMSGEDRGALQAYADGLSNPAAPTAP